MFWWLLKKTGKLFLNWEEGEWTSYGQIVEGTDILCSASPLSPSGKMGSLHFTPLTFSIVGVEKGKSEIPIPFSLPGKKDPGSLECC